MPGGDELRTGCSPRGGRRRPTHQPRQGLSPDQDRTAQLSSGASKSAGSAGCPQPGLLNSSAARSPLASLTPSARWPVLVTSRTASEAVPTPWRTRLTRVAAARVADLAYPCGLRLYPRYPEPNLITTRDDMLKPGRIVAWMMRASCYVLSAPASLTDLHSPTWGRRLLNSARVLRRGSHRPYRGQTKRGPRAATCGADLPSFLPAAGQ